MTQEIEFNFQGETFDKARDGKRLGSQLNKVRAFMLDGKWHTLGEISDATGAPEASASARLRNLRQMGNVVEDRRITNSLWEYRLVRQS